MRARVCVCVRVCVSIYLCGGAGFVSIHPLGVDIGAIKRGVVEELLCEVQGDVCVLARHGCLFVCVCVCVY
jgi:hypothetical protein